MSSSMIANENAKKFNDGYVEKAREYVEFFMQQQPEGKEISNFREVVPTVAGLSLYLGVHRDTIHAWSTSDKDEHKPFQEIVSDLSNVREVLTLSGGLKGVFNPKITTLVLNHHGYSEKVQTDHTSSDGSMKQPTQIRIVAPGHNDNS